MRSGRFMSLVLAAYLSAASVAAAENVRIMKGPVVEHTSDTTAMVAWSTNVSSSTVVKYGTDPNNLNLTAETPWGSLTHRVILRNLKPGTTYYYRATSGQAEGTGSTIDSQVSTFRTQGTTNVSAAQ